MNRIELIEKVTEDVKERLLLEMATFGRINDGKDMYKIAIHGPASNDRPMPHIHIYLNNDVFPYSQFNFEVSLVDLVCKDEINLIAQIDRKNNIKRTNRSECSCEGYRDLYKTLAQVRKSVDSPPGMLTEDHHHTVTEERQVCSSSHLRPNSLTL